MKKTLLKIYSFFFFVSTLSAQEVNGVFDLYWNMNSQKNQISSNLENLPHKDLGIGLASLRFKGSQENVDYYLEFAYGDQASLVASSATSGTEGLSQAYLTHNFNDQFSITVGRMDISVGFESNFAVNNTHYSRSLGFNSGGPNFAEGVALRYKKDSLFAEVFYFDGPDQLENTESTNGYNLLISYEWEKWMFIYAYLAEQDNENSSFHDFSLKHKTTNEISLALDILVGSIDEERLGGRWSSFAFYFSYILSGKSFLATRLELWKQEDIDLIGNNRDETITSITLTYGYKVYENSELKFEFRLDTADNSIYVDDEGNPEDSQSNLSLAWLTRF